MKIYFVMRYNYIWFQKTYIDYCIHWSFLSGIIRVSDLMKNEYLGD